MGAESPENTFREATAQVQEEHGRTGVGFTYDQSASRLTYRDLVSNEITINGADIIGAFPKPHKRPEHDIVYALDANEPGKQDKPPRVCSITAPKLPDEFLHDYGYEFASHDEKQERFTKEQPPNTHVIVSTLSGISLAKEFYERAVQRILTYLGLKEEEDYALHYTQSVKTIMNLTTSVFLPRANQGTRQNIILLSGDGGVIDIINALLSAPIEQSFRAPELSILPLGTGNALAHSTSVTKDNTFRLATLVRGHPKQLPIFKATFSPGARLLTEEGSVEEELAHDSQSGAPTLYGGVVCSWGMHASLVGDSDTAEYRKYGVERFKMAAKEALFPADGLPPHAYKAKVLIFKPDGSGQEKWEPIPREEHMYVLATLVANLEKSFTISPDSKPLEGRLRLVHFGPMSAEEIMRIMGLAYQGGRHVKEPAVGYEEIDGLRIEFGGREEDARWRRVCVDGKIIRVEKDGWVELRKEKKHILDVVCMA